METNEEIKDRLFFLCKSALSSFRKEQYEKQGKICPILKQHISLDYAVVDHKHKRKSDPVNKDNSGGGLVRGVIHSSCNQVEGKIQNAFKRFGLERHISLPEFLRNLADYLENPPAEQIYVHPNEWSPKKAPKLYQRDYKLVCKYWHLISPKSKTLPEFPKSGTVTKKWEQWITKAKELKNNK